MANDISTIQSLKAVDAWIDVINANINGGVRTAFKASRLRFAGSNTMLDRAPTATSLPLQLPEPGLITANTVIDWSQGAITSSTETTHLAIQGEGFFLVASPNAIAANGTAVDPAANPSVELYVTRDGEFHTNKDGLLVNAQGYFLVTWNAPANGQLSWSTAASGINSYIRAVYNNIDSASPATAATHAVRLSDYLASETTSGWTLADGVTVSAYWHFPIIGLSSLQQLKYTKFGSTVLDFGFQTNGAGFVSMSPEQNWQVVGPKATILSKSLEASNSSMTQSVPELSLAQKLFSALTKVLQISQTNTDSVLNLVR